MSKEEFTAYYGMTPERAKQILEELRHIVNLDSKLKPTFIGTIHGDCYIEMGAEEAEDDKWN